MLSRRSFGKLALSAVPSISAFGQIDSKVNGVQIGAAMYSFRDRPLDESIKAMKDIGLGSCEVFNQYPHIEPVKNDLQNKGSREELRAWRTSVPMDDIRRVRKAYDDAGIAVTAFTYNMSDDFTDEELDRIFQMAQALGTNRIVTSTTQTVAKRLVPLMEKYKMQVGFHGHSNVKNPNEFASPESFDKGLALSPYARINLDVGHFFAAGFDPVQFIRERHDMIFVIHLKDRKKNNGPNMPWGQGDTPLKAVLQLLKQEKYPIAADIEYEYRGANSVIEVAKCFQYCRDALV